LCYCTVPFGEQHGRLGGLPVEVSDCNFLQNVNFYSRYSLLQDEWLGGNPFTTTIQTGKMRSKSGTPAPAQLESEIYYKGGSLK